ncbi:MAG: hypothetical protein V1874_17800 [Spirochaetota bacterium]
MYLKISVMEQEIKRIRKAAYKTLHLIFVKYVGPGAYRIVNSEAEGGIPVLTDYISFHYHEPLIRVKDIGKNIIYLVTQERFKLSFLGKMIQLDPGLETKLHAWFPFLWGEGTAEDVGRYKSILRQLKELADITVPPNYGQ